MRRVVFAFVFVVVSLNRIDAQTPTTDQINKQIQQVQQALDALKLLVNPGTPLPVPTPPPPPTPPPTPPPPSGAVITVPSGGNVQLAIDGAASGTTILLAANGSFSQITLRNKGVLSAPITIKSDANIPATGTRPTGATVLPRIVSNDGLAPIRSEQKATNYTIEGLSPQPVAGNPGMALVELGTDTATLATDQPDKITLLHMKIVANPTTGGKRAISAQTQAFVLRDSYIAGFSYVGQDSQGFAAWNGSGPYTLDNNYIEASGENILFGGADSQSVANQPHNVVIRGNYVTKPVAWKANTSIQVKTLIEIKNAVGVLIENNTFEYSWLSAQDGYAILLTPRNQNGAATYSQVKDVTVQWNVFRHIAAFAQITGEDNEHPSARTMNIKFLNNAVYDVDPVKWGTATHYAPLFLILSGPLNTELGHNSVVYSNPNSNTQTGISACIVLGNSVTYKADGLNIHDSIFSEGSYGIFGPAGLGRPALTGDAPNAILQDTLFIRKASDPINYGPDKNYVSAIGETVIDPATGLPVKTYVTTDGKPIGVDILQLKVRIPTLDLSK